jgi:hypothetical protein
LQPGFAGSPGFFFPCFSSTGPVPAPGRPAGPGFKTMRGTYFSYGLKKIAIYLKRSYINSCCLAGQERDQAKQDQSDLKGNYLRQLYFFLSSGEFVNYS